MPHSPCISHFIDGLDGFLAETQTAELREHYNNEKYQRSFGAARNLLLPTEIIHLKSLLTDVADWKAVNLLDNVVRSIEFNHRVSTLIEQRFFHYIQKHKLDYWRDQTHSVAQTIYIHFYGTGVPIFPKNCTPDNIIEDHAKNAYVYRIPGIGSSANGKTDPDSHIPNGAMYDRVKADFQAKEIFTIARSAKVKNGQGIVRGVLDASAHIRKLVQSGALETGANVVVFGHSRGSIAALLLAHVIEQHPLFLYLNDPVSGGELRDVHNDEIELNINHAYKLIPSKVKQVIIFIACSEMRARFENIDCSKLICSPTTNLRVLVTSGYHNSNIFGDYDTSLDAFSFGIFSYFIKGYQATEPSFSERETVKLVYLRHIHHALCQYQLSSKNYNSEAIDEHTHDAYKMLLKHYAHWLLNDFDRKLMTPSFMVFQNKDSRDITPYQSQLSGLFYDKEHERIFRVYLPNLYAYLLASSLKTFKDTHPQIMSMVDEEFALLDNESLCLVERYLLYRQTNNDFTPCSNLCEQRRPNRTQLENLIQKLPSTHDYFKEQWRLEVLFDYCIKQVIGAPKHSPLQADLNAILNSTNSNSYYQEQPIRSQSEAIDGEVPIVYLLPFARQSQLKQRTPPSRDSYELDGSNTPKSSY